MRSRVRVALPVLAALALVAAVASPVRAHGGGNAETNLRSQVVAAPAGLDVRVAPDGSSITLTTTHSVVVLGYSGEPFLRYADGAVADNANSLTSYSAATGVAASMPRSAGRGPVRWRVLATATTHSWPDSRIAWTGSRLPAEVLAAPKADHVVSRWRIPLRIDGRAAAITGEVLWTADTTSVGLTVGVVLGLLALVLLLSAYAAFPGLRRRRGQAAGH